MTDVLHPHPNLAGIGAFALQGAGQIDRAVASIQVFLMQASYARQELLERGDEAARQHRDPVQFAIAVADDDDSLGKVEIVDPQRRHSVGRRPLPQRSFVIS